MFLSSSEPPIELTSVQQDVTISGTYIPSEALLQSSDMSIQSKFESVSDTDTGISSLLVKDIDTTMLLSLTENFVSPTSTLATEAMGTESFIADSSIIETISDVHVISSVLDVTASAVDLTDSVSGSDASLMVSKYYSVTSDIFSDTVVMASVTHSLADITHLDSITVQSSVSTSGFPSSKLHLMTSEQIPSLIASVSPMIQSVRPTDSSMVSADMFSSYLEPSESLSQPQSILLSASDISLTSDIQPSFYSISSAVISDVTSTTSGIFYSTTDETLLASEATQLSVSLIQPSATDFSMYTNATDIAFEPSVTIQTSTTDMTIQTTVRNITNQSNTIDTVQPSVTDISIQSSTSDLFIQPSVSNITIQSSKIDYSISESTQHFEPSISDTHSSTLQSSMTTLHSSIPFSSELDSIDVTSIKMGMSDHMFSVSSSDYSSHVLATVTSSLVQTVSPMLSDKIDLETSSSISTLSSSMELFEDSVSASGSTLADLQFSTSLPTSHSPGASSIPHTDMFYTVIASSGLSDVVQSSAIPSVDQTEPVEYATEESIGLFTSEMPDIYSMDTTSIQMPTELLMSSLSNAVSVDLSSVTVFPSDISQSDMLIEPTSGIAIIRSDLMSANVTFTDISPTAQSMESSYDISSSVSSSQTIAMDSSTKLLNASDMSTYTGSMISQYSAVYNASELNSIFSTLSETYSRTGQVTITPTDAFSSTYMSTTIQQNGTQLLLSSIMDITSISSTSPYASEDISTNFTSTVGQSETTYESSMSTASVRDDMILTSDIHETKKTATAISESLAEISPSVSKFLLSSSAPSALLSSLVQPVSSKELEMQTILTSESMDNTLLPSTYAEIEVSFTASGSLDSVAATKTSLFTEIASVDMDSDFGMSEISTHIQETISQETQTKSFGSEVKSSILESSSLPESDSQQSVVTLHSNFSTISLTETPLPDSFTPIPDPSTPISVTVAPESNYVFSSAASIFDSFTTDHSFTSTEVSSLQSTTDSFDMASQPASESSVIETKATSELRRIFNVCSFDTANSFIRFGNGRNYKSFYRLICTYFVAY